MAVSSLRCWALYHCETTTVVHTVFLLLSTVLRGGRRLPFSRERPRWPFRRGGAGLYRAASSRSRVISVPPVPICWVLVRDPTGEHAPAAFLSTDLKATPDMILAWFVSRWRVETTFQEVRTHLGVETQRQWSDRAILRTTPVLLGLFSLITLWADDLARNTAAALRPNATGWYCKSEPTFSDAIAAVRRVLWCPPDFSISRLSGKTVEIPTALLNRVFQTLCLAA